MNLSKTVKNVKNFVKASIRNEQFTELYDVDNNSVIFFTDAPENISEGVEATPDGEFIFQDGKKIIISDGKVKEIVVPEGQQTEQKPSEEDEKDIKIKELEKALADKEAEIAGKEAEIAAMNEEIAKKNAEIDAKEAEVKEVEEDLKEIKNFYTEINKHCQERQEPSDEERKSFKFTA